VLHPEPQSFQPEISILPDKYKQCEICSEISIWQSLRKDKYKNLARKYILKNIVPPSEKHLGYLSKIIISQGIQSLTFL